MWNWEAWSIHQGHKLLGLDRKKPEALSLEKHTILNVIFDSFFFAEK